MADMNMSVSAKTAQVTFNDIIEGELEDAQLEASAFVAVVEEAQADELKNEGNVLARLGKKPDSDKDIEDRKVDKKKDSAVGNLPKPFSQKEAEDMADEFHKQNPWINPKDLITLLGRLNPNDSKDTILKYVFAQYPDLNEASKALEFLAKTTGAGLLKEVKAAQEAVFEPINSIVEGDTKVSILAKLESAYPYPILVNQALGILLERTTESLHEQVSMAKEEIVTNFPRELRLMGVSKQVTGVLKEVKLDMAPGDFSDRYNKLLGNPLEFHTLDAELDAMDPTQKKAYLKALSHIASKDVKMEATYIEKAKIQTVIDQIRTMQASIGVDNESDRTVKEDFRIAKANDVTLPPQITPKTHRKEVISLAAQRYPNPEQVAQSAVNLGFKKIG